MKLRRKTVVRERSITKGIEENHEIKNYFNVFNISGDYKDLLLRYIDADNLPACYGGKLTDPDGNPNCASMVS